MPVFANTPESRLGRTDSLDPATTCRGITGGGRPCRRALNKDEAGPTKTSYFSKNAKLRADDPSDESLYCWQHKDQAAMSAHSTPGPQMAHTPVLQGRTSIDTLAERLGLMRTNSRPKPSIFGGGSQQGSRPSKQKTFTCCFCIDIPIPGDDFMPPPRPMPTPVQPTSVSTPHRPNGKKPGRKSKLAPPIPRNASPQTIAKLETELAKPFSVNDDPGYIYIFWLTPESDPATPPGEVARSLLTPGATLNRGSNVRTISDLLAAFAFDEDDDGRPRSRSAGGGGKKKILLKIGRATNVQRRLNEWKRQCGYNLSLIRYYPYVPSNSPATGERKVPHSHKVERLVHIELTGMGLRDTDRDKCEACGKEHREWFEVDASRKAVAEVDEVVRKWSDWDEAQA
ncbi:meiotically up-regulated gene 113-domain-containing protein [Podospora australis]|uniref:Meiotically up-regulated gene 113-domain-containing protein n=1 Tax=Podospora australis TaxID=1536484 RepID=A0AAN6X0D6_9PEZI|nr:meiotically up-regulated gene 113-domain-containing protein [Podospora australis]